MMKVLRAIRDAVVVTALVGLSFWAGWWAYGYDFLNSRRLTADFSKPFYVPLGYESLSTAATPETAPFAVGDRIDIFIVVGGVVEPLILDAVVTHQTPTNFGMLLPHGGRDVLIHARQIGLRLIYRPSIAPSAPVTIESPGEGLND
jgi:hypothetical protein